MFNLLDKIKENPYFFRQLAIDDQLISKYNCPLETPKDTIWTTQDYFVYVIEGKKTWHLPGQSFELTPGKCIFVRKGVHVVEQYFDQPFCFIVFFISDQFIADTVRTYPMPSHSYSDDDDGSPISYIAADDALHGFFNSVMPYFMQHTDTHKNLLELKFKELILNVVNNPSNGPVSRYFYSLLSEDRSGLMKSILEENFYHNLRLEEYARMCGKSLSSFKREFEAHFHTTPGRWLLSRRLRHAEQLLNTTDKTISEIAFDSGFENVSHFSRAFKQHYGNSPAQFRRVPA